MTRHASVLKTRPGGPADATTPASPGRLLLRTGRATPPPPPPRTGTWLADTEWEALRRECHDQGYQMGLNEGRRQAASEMREPLQREADERIERALARHADELAHREAREWSLRADRLQAQFNALGSRLQAEVTDWAFAAVVRLLGRADPADIGAAVRQVLVEAGLEGPLRIRMHPSDLQRWQAGADFGPTDRPEGLEAVADPRVQLGGFLLESPVQTLDARLEVQLGLLKQALDAARAATAPTPESSQP